MRIIAISDIHGNLAALEAVLQAVGPAPDRWIVAGDLVAFGPDPGPVIDRVRTLDPIVVKGNLDDYTAQPGAFTRLRRYAEAERAAGRPFRPVLPLELVGAQADWSRTRLSPDQLAYLSGLPLRAELDLGKGRRILVIHANAHDLERPLLPGSAPLDGLLDPTGYDLVLYGHVHVPGVYEHGGTRLVQARLVNVASAGFPTDGDPRPAFTEILAAGEEIRVIQHRVAYDLDRAEAAIRASGLPEPDLIAALLRTARRVRDQAAGDPHGTRKSSTPAALRSLPRSKGT